MQNHSQTGRGGRLGRVAAMLNGALNVVSVVYIVSTPGASRYGMGEFLRCFSECPLALPAVWIVFAMTAVLSCAVVPLAYGLVRDIARDWARAATLSGARPGSLRRCRFPGLAGGS